MTNQKPIVYVDMDGVLADFDALALVDLPMHVRSQRVNFYVVKDYPEYRHVIHKRQQHHLFFEELPVIEGALNGWQRLIDLGYDPVILSAPLSMNVRSIEGKKAWLVKHFVPEFGPSVVERAIIDKQKFRYDGLALIDDRAQVVPDGENASWTHIVMDRAYNKESLAKFRLMNWHDENLANILTSIADS